ncbi:hypothetical protein BKK44_14455 [Bacillus cereus]|nr:hypothetical protein BKK44_14455 [Bacillus cereus]
MWNVVLGMKKKFRRDKIFIFYLAWAIKEIWLAKYIHLFGDTTAAFLTVVLSLLLGLYFAFKTYIFNNQTFEVEAC